MQATASAILVDTTSRSLLDAIQDVYSSADRPSDRMVDECLEQQADAEILEAAHITSDAYAMSLELEPP